MDFLGPGDVFLLLLIKYAVPIGMLALGIGFWALKATLSNRNVEQERKEEQAWRDIKP